MRKQFLRALSIILAMLIAVSALPITALADELNNLIQNINTVEQSTGSDAEEKGEENSANSELDTQISQITVPEPENGSDSGLIGEIISTEDGFRIQMNEDGKSYSVLSYIGSAKNVQVPSSYLGLPVNRIRDYAFRNKKSVVRVIIPDSITRIDEGVFDGCTSLNYNVIDGGNYLGNPENSAYYFAGPIDKNITEFAVNNATRLVGSCAFYHCERLEKVTIPDSVIQIGYNAVGWCDNLEKITLPFIGEDGLYDFNAHFGYIFGARTYGGNLSYVPVSLKTVIVNGGKRIAKGALYGVDQIKELTVPFLGANAADIETAYLSFFWNADSYKQNIAPSTLKKITVLGGAVCEAPFYRCVSVEDIDLISCTGVTLAEAAFDGCAKLTDITIPDGITAIGNSAFSGCTELKSVTLPSSIESIGYDAFKGCKVEKIYISDIVKWCNSLASAAYMADLAEKSYTLYLNGEAVTDVVLPDTVLQICNRAFYNCTNITGIVIPEGVKSIGSDAFNGCSALASVAVPESVATVGSSAFYGCKSLKAIKLPELVTKIENYAFYDCTSLETVELPDNIVSIGVRAFFNCQSVTKLRLSDSITTIGEYAFNNCQSATEINIPKNITSIAKNTFYNCNKMSEIMLPEGLTTIGDYAFEKCSSVESISLPSSLSNISNTAFNDCSPTNIYIDDISVWCESLATQAFKLRLMNKAYTLYLNGVALTELTLPDGIESIGEYTFYNCVNLTDVTMPDSVTSIGEQVFYNCSNLKSIKMSDNVTSIGRYAFYNCSSLTEFVIPNGVTSIAEYTFGGCTALETITIPSGVTSFGYNSFGRSLSNIYITDIASWCNTISAKLYSLNLLNSGYSLYLNGELIEDLIVPSTVTAIGDYNFYCCKSIKRVVLPSSVKSIGKSAFEKCDSLVNITIPTSVTKIGDYAFRDCSGLTSITVPASVTSIGNQAFNGCRSLYMVYNNTIFSASFGSSSNGYLGYYAKIIVDKYGNKKYKSELTYEYIDTADKFLFRKFNGVYTLMSYFGTEDTVTLPDNINGYPYEINYMKGVENVIIPEGVTSIGNNAFDGCKSLVSVTLPASVTKIGDYAFGDCSGLTSITVPAGVTSISNTAFYNCESLKEIIIDENNTSFCTVNGIIYDKDLTRIVYVTLGVGDEVVIPETVTVIEENTFVNRENITSVVLGKGITTLERSAFNGCSNLSRVYLSCNIENFDFGAFIDCAISEIYIDDMSAWCKGFSLEASNGGMFSNGYSLYLNGELVEELTLSEDVTYLFVECFKNCKSLKKIILPSKLTTIYYDAFRDCSNLESIVLPESVNEIYRNAFYGCESLKEITIPAAVTEIAENAFYGCKALTSVKLSAGVTSIGKHAFYGCESLNKIVIPEGVTEIGPEMFYGCKSLTEITLPSTVKSIGERAFYGCESLIKIEIPTGVTEIGNKMFYGCKALAEIKLPDTVTRIGEQAFYGCESLLKITIPEGVTEIEYGTFDNCKLLAEIIIPQTVSSIGDRAFYGCSSLTEVVLPEGVTQVGSSAFSNCVSLKEIIIPENVTSVESYAFSGCSALTKALLPRNLTVINSYTFDNCTSLAEIVIPDGVTAINTYAFNNCSSLTQIVIPNSVTTIGDRAFMSCKGLQSIAIPDSVTAIGAYVFYNCSNITKVTLPTGITSISNTAFSGCRITDIYISDMSNWCSSLSAILYGAGMLNYRYSLYLNGEPVVDLTVPSDITVIKANTFKNCISISSVTLQSGVTTIENYAFSTCMKLESIVLPDTLTTIGSYAFENCSSLKAVNIPSGVTSIGTYAFRYCSALNELKLSSGLTSIGNYAFYNCNKLESIVLPDTLTSIGNYAFYGCNLVKKLTVPSKVTTIGGNAFNGCSSLYLVYNNSSLSLSCGSTGYGYVAYYAKMIVDSSGNKTYRKVTNTEFIDTDDGFLFTNSNGVYKLIAYLGDEETVTLPESINGSEYTISQLRGAVNVILPKFMTTVVSDSFVNSISLKSVDLSYVTSIESKAFSGCTNLTGIIYNGELNEWRHMQKASDWDGGITGYTVTCGENNGLLYDTNEDLTEFYASGYRGADTTVIVPESYCTRPVTKIYEKAFYNNLMLVSVVLPETVTFIGEYAFSGCSALQNVNIPSAVESLSFGMFSGCESLGKLVIPFIGSSAAADATSYIGYIFGADSYSDNPSAVPEALTEITVTGGNIIPSYAFWGCSSLKKIELSDSLTEIGSYAFSGCLALQGFVIPDSVGRVGTMVFEGCSNLESITIGESLSSIADQAVGNPLFGINKASSALSEYIVSEKNTVFATDSYGILYKKLNLDEQELFVTVMDAPAITNLQDYVLPEHIVEIAPYAFAYNATLRSVNLEYVRMIDTHAFFEATGLINVSFGNPESPDSSFIDAVSGLSYSQYVGDMAFKGCTSLLKANIESEMLVGIGEQAFADCSALKTVILGKNIQRIGLNAFGTTASGESHLEQFAVAEENPHFKSIAGVLYGINSDNSLTLLSYPAYKAIFEEDGTVHDRDGVRIYPTEFAIPAIDDNGKAVTVSAIESFAFETAEYLNKLVLDTENALCVGDYAFTLSKIQSVTVGENVTSLGLKRGEGEYTVFADCDYLTEINVSDDNAYYSSQNGVLFDKTKTKLIKYPAAKTGDTFVIPTTVAAIASMAFKNNTSLRAVTASSYISSIGLEAFYHCSRLEVIFFDSVYAPVSVLENAFTTWVSVDEDNTRNPETVIGFSADCYLNGNTGEYGWINYAETYTLEMYESLPELSYKEGNGYYAVVVVDEKGNRMENASVILTDPNGNTEAVATGSQGVAMFYDLFGKESLGFAIDFDMPYTIKVSNVNGKYYPYISGKFYLDGETRITYITLVKIPVVPSLNISGVSCNNIDINSQTADINKAMFDKNYDSITLKNPDKGYTEDNIILSGETSEEIEISVIGYYNTSDAVLINESSMLYQNGVAIENCKVLSTEINENSATVTFTVPVDSLIPEVPVEARLAVTNDIVNEASVFLNINIFDFTVDSDDINLETNDLSIDLKGAGDIIVKLLGSQSFNFNIGEDIGFSTVVDGDTVTLSLNAEYSAEKEKTKNYGTDYKKGYEANHGANNKNTWFFQKTGILVDGDGVSHTYTFNIRFARGTEKENYYYYRCYIYEKNYNNQKALFYGAVKATGGRAAVAAKAAQIYLTYLDSAKENKDITKGKQYVESLKKASKTSSETKNSFEATLYGDIVFQYQQGKGLVPVTSLIKGELKYSFSHKQQFVVWIIPITVEIGVDINGEVYLQLKYDDYRSVSIDEAKMTISAEVTAKLGVGCSLISAGVYGTVGTVFVLEFYPELEVEKWTVSGKMAAYATYYTLRWKKGFLIYYPVFESVTKEAVIFDKNWTIIDNTDAEAAELISTDSLYLANAYSAAGPEFCEEKATLFVMQGKLYKVYYTNLSATDGYDEFNYMKLAIACWDKALGEWSAPVIIDDNGYNDFAYELYKTEQGIRLVYTQQTEKTNKETAEDSYEYVSDLAVKYAVIDDFAAEFKVETVVENSNYKYLSYSSAVNSTDTVVWAENADNNMFGVSPYNYIDENGESHIFETKANSVWMSSFVDGVWSKPYCIANGLAPVTKLVVTSDGYVVYILDTNCNIADTDDRKLYFTKPGSGIIKCLEIEENVSIADIKVVEGSLIYNFTGEKNGVAYLDLEREESSVIDLPQDVFITEGYKAITKNGIINAFLYTQSKNWTEDSVQVDGSAIYGVFRNGNEWGRPVELNTELITAVANCYITSFDACFAPDSDSRLIITAEYIGSDGALLGAVTDELVITSNVTLCEYSVDYQNKILKVTAVNNGGAAASMYAVINNGKAVILAENVVSGNTVECELDLNGYGLTPKVVIADSNSNSTIATIDDINLNYSDLKLSLKQITLGGRDVLLIAVKNTGNLANSGTLYVKCGSQTADTVKEDAYSVKVDSVAPGTISYYEVLLEGELQISGNTIITAFIEPELSTEKGSSAYNNIVYTTLKEYTASVLEDGSSYKPTTDVAYVDFDREIGNDVTVTYSFANQNGLQSVMLDDTMLSANTDYICEEAGAGGALRIKAECLSGLSGGEYMLFMTFGDGNVLAVRLNVQKYYNVIWKNENGSIIKQEALKEGCVPSFDGSLTKADTESETYSFAGWDSNADGVADALGALNSDLELTAVFNPFARQYTVIWVFINQSGERVEIAESYAYGAIPNYKGEKFYPQDMSFVGWDNEITAVDGNKEYVAEYKKEKVGTAVITNSEFKPYRGESFTTRLSLKNISDMTETVITLKYSSNLAILDNVFVGENVTLLEQGEGYITLSVKNISDTELYLAELSFTASKNLPLGENEFLSAEAQDSLTEEFTLISLWQSGDINCDGKVDVRDLVRIKKLTAGSENTVFDDADFNCDGDFNAVDISILRKHLLGMALISNILGDINADGIADEADIDYLNSYFADNTIMLSSTSDINDDGIIDTSDLIELCRIVYKK